MQPIRANHTRAIFVLETTRHATRSNIYLPIMTPLVTMRTVYARWLLCIEVESLLKDGEASWKDASFTARAVSDALSGVH
jgi:hypothetical protein